MLAVRAMDFRNNFKTYCDRVVNGDLVVVSRKNNENVVLVSENIFNDLLKAKRETELLKLRSAVFEAEQERMQNGKVFTADEVFAELEQHYVV